MLGIGGVLTFMGIIASIVGGVFIGETSPDSEDWSGELKWEGTTPTTYSGDFDWTHIYNVWVEEGSSVQVEVIGGDSDNRFVSCEELEDCRIYDEDGAILGYEYIGEISVFDSGTWQVEFTDDNGGNVDVMIRDEGSLGGILGILGGSIACCFGILFLIIGGIMAATMKNKPKVEISPIVLVGTEDEGPDFSMGATSAEEEELFINISNKLIEYNYHDVKKLATDLKLNFDSDYPPEDYGFGSIIDSEPWQEMGRTIEWDGKLNESIDQFHSSEIDERLERLATEYGVVHHQVKKEKYIGQNKCDLISAIIDAQNSGDSKEEIIKRLQKEVEQEKKITSSTTKKEEKNYEWMKNIDDVILGSRPTSVKEERFGVMDALTAAWCPQCNSRMKSARRGYYCSSCDMNFDKNGSPIWL